MKQAMTFFAGYIPFEHKEKQKYDSSWRAVCRAPFPVCPQAAYKVADR